MPWWLKNNLRLIQNNLRDLDAQMDVDALVKTVKEDFCANVLMVGAAGISAFYPTKQEFQTVSPYLNGRDVLGEIVEKCHAKGIRVIARFDFSKTHISHLAAHPQWYYRDLNGEVVHYNDTAQTCCCGPYQQEKSLEMIREVIENYPVDGIFFNMFGFFTRDYSNVYHGICQCENCKMKFLGFSGMELPTREQDGDEAFEAYKRFKEFIVEGMLEKIHGLARSVNPEVAVCTYHHHKVDMIRDESNSAVDRPLPFWLYSGSENTQSVHNTWSDKISSNCVINAVDIFYRFQGVSPYLTQMRLYQAIASGSGLDFCIIGAFEDYPDRENLPLVQEVFRFHARHEEYFGHMESAARVLLIRPGRTHATLREYHGMYRMLKEEHIPFDVLRWENLEEGSKKLSRYRAVILPDIRHTPCEAFLNALETSGAHVIATGLPFGKNDDLRRGLFGIEGEETAPPTRSSYLYTEQKDVFTRFPLRDWVFVDGDMRYLTVKEGIQKLLPFVYPAMYGPPERCYGYSVSPYPGVILRPDGARSWVHFPFAAGALYEKCGYADHKYLLLDVLFSLPGTQSAFTTNAPESVEVFFNPIGGGKYMLQLLNISGFNGSTFARPVPAHDLWVRFDNPEFSSCKRLTEDGGESWTLHDHKLQLDCLKRYEAFVLEEK